MTVATTTIKAGPYTGNGVTTDFSYGWRIFSKSDLVVYETDSAGVVTTLVVDTDYTVSGVLDSGGGTITRVGGALPTGSEWLIKSNLSPTQLTDFQNQGAFFPETHENALDKLTRLIQELREFSTRAVSFPETYGGSLVPVLPTPGALKHLRWNSAGTQLENGDAIVSFVDKDAPLVSSAAALKALSTSSVVNAFLTGYYNNGDGGGGQYYFDATETAADNGGTVIAPDSGTGRWKLFSNGVVSIKQFGAVGDGVADAAAAIQAAINWVEANDKALYTPAGTYLVNTQLLLDAGDVTIYGDGRQSVLKTTADINILRISSASRCTIRDVAFEGNSTGSNQDGIRAINVTDSNFHNIYVKNVGHDGILLISGCTGNSITGCHVDGTGDDGFNVGGDSVAASRDNTLSGCVAENCANDGFHISDGSQATTVSGCVSKGNDVGIGIYDCSQITITGCMFTGNTTYGARTQSTAAITDITITGNVFNGGTHGIFFDRQCNRVTISANIFRAMSSVGIYLLSSGLASQNLVVANNVLEGSLGSAQRGIYIGNALYWNVTGNSIKSMAEYGILAVYSAATDCDGLIEGNLIQAGCTEAGIHLERADHLDVLSNRLVSLTGDGIRLDTNACDNVTVQTNRLRSITGTEINKEAGTNITIQNNQGYTTEGNGNASLSPGGAGTATIPHGLVGTPTYANLQVVGDSAVEAQVQSLDGTNVTVRIRNTNDNSDVTSGSYTVHWEAKFAA